MLDWIADHAPGSRIVVGLEGTRSYGIALARALTHAGMTVVEVERPKREQRRGRGKSDPIDAHLAALQVLRMDADRLPLPRADGDREALRILLVGRRALADTQTRNRTNSRLCCSPATLPSRACPPASSLTRGWAYRPPPRHRHRDPGPGDPPAEARRLAAAILDAERELRANKSSCANSSRRSHQRC